MEIQRQERGWIVVLPESIDFLGEAVYLKPLGNALVLIPADRPWEGFCESLDLFSEDCFEDVTVQGGYEVSGVSAPQK